MKKFLQFVLAMVIAWLPWVLGMMFTPMGHNNVWYNGLNVSVLTPAGWVFGVAWTILYVLLGLSLFMVMQTNNNRVGKTRAYTLFVAQMLLNALWSMLFFGGHAAGVALIIVIMLLGVSLLMLRAFRYVNRWASYLLWPYVIWLGFATYLNWFILYMN